MKEDTKRALVRCTAWGGWVVTLLILAGRLHGTLGQEWGLVAVSAIGVSVVSGLATSRFKLQDTIASALAAGYELTRIRHRQWHDEMDGQREEE